MLCPSRVCRFVAFATGAECPSWGRLPTRSHQKEMSAAHPASPCLGKNTLSGKMYENELRMALGSFLRTRHLFAEMRVTDIRWPSHSGRARGSPCRVPMHVRPWRVSARLARGCGCAEPGRGHEAVPVTAWQRACEASREPRACRVESCSSEAGGDQSRGGGTEQEDAARSGASSGARGKVLASPAASRTRWLLRAVPMHPRPPQWQALGTGGRRPQGGPGGRVAVRPAWAGGAAHARLVGFLCAPEMGQQFRTLLVTCQLPA